MGDGVSPILRCEGLTKSFGVQALKDVDFAVGAGCVHGLVGENGAGKSTLLKILSSVYRPDSGRIALCDAPYAPAPTDDALRSGIVTIHQDINLIATMTVAENILLNNEPKRGPLGLLRARAMHDQAAALLRRYEVDVDPGAPVEGLPNDCGKCCKSSRRSPGTPACC